jgi:hypothetical protein
LSTHSPAERAIYQGEGLCAGAETLTYMICWFMIKGMGVKLKVRCRSDLAVPFQSANKRAHSQNFTIQCRFFQKPMILTNPAATPLGRLTIETANR